MIVIHHGERLYGKVDHVPGLFYVATRFFHLQYFPLIPLGSVLILAGTKRHGTYQMAPIPFSAKSMLMAWLRIALVAASVCFVAGGLFVITEQADISGGIALVVSGIILWVLLGLSYHWTRARVARALELAAQVGISPETIAQAYVKNRMISTQDSDAPPA